MQFKHPEILWALLLLLIPILIHLFQLRRFKKTPFTNVAMLQKVVAESRKSNNLKKWLLLLTRLMLLSVLVIAFSQPYNASKTALQPKETVVYLDNSFSMQAKVNGLSLLEKSVQDFIKNVGDEDVFSLFTNDETFKNVSLKDIQNKLLSLRYTHMQLSLDAIQLKSKSLFSNSQATLKNLIVASDFQQNMGILRTPVDSSIQSYYVPLLPKNVNNIALDSVYFQGLNTDQVKLTILLSGGKNEESIPISLYNNDVLIAKTAASFKANGLASIVLPIPAKQEIKGRASIQDNSLDYDNHFYFNLDKREKIKAIAISDTNDSYLQRLYVPEEFELTKFSIDQLDYSALDNQNVVVLNQLQSIPAGLQKVLRTFKDNGGTIILVPSKKADIGSYNEFLSGFFATRFINFQAIDKKITTIAFDHPLFNNVFEKEVYNFQYPSVYEYYQIQTRAPKILSMEGGEPFLSGNNGFYFFSAPLELESSNFKNSPLIVPVFYNMAALSLKAPQSYHTLGEPIEVDLPIDLGNDDILNVSKMDYQFIPRQQSFNNKVRLTFGEHPTTDGIFEIDKAGMPIKNISFNYPRNESKLNYLDIAYLEQANAQESIDGVFNYLKAENTITAYWKWFVILALLLALLEVIIQKFVT